VRQGDRPPCEELVALEVADVDAVVCHVVMFRSGTRDEFSTEFHVKIGNGGILDEISMHIRTVNEGTHCCLNNHSLITKSL
jgi:hypothetical protein